MPRKVDAPSTERAEPQAAALVEALRSVGYSPETAVADLIDNSIAANASSVWLHFHWNGPHSVMWLLDNGKGMSERELTRAMTPGSRSPTENRSPDDLGRFGLGLKTASFSQCRRVTVATREKKTRRFASRTWDLDFVVKTGDWLLLKEPPSGAAPFLKELETLEYGTIVIWENMDRLVGDEPVTSEPAHRRFFEMISTVERHLGMVFHKFIEKDEGGSVRLRLHLNGRTAKHLIKAWDPFSPHDARHAFPKVTRMGVSFQGFVLPHKDRISEKELEYAAGPGGWLAQQGFYIYRNSRILVAGDWLGLGFARDEASRLARLSIEIPNALDHEWDIDIKKSRARPPGPLRAELRQVAELARRRSRETFARRGKRGYGGAPEPLARPWRVVERNGRNNYLINREHPLVQSLGKQGSASKDGLEALLRLLEETVPVQQIWLDAAEKPDTEVAPFSGQPDANLLAVMKQVVKSLIAAGFTEHEARSRLYTMEPFNLYSSIIDSLDLQN